MGSFDIIGTGCRQREQSAQGVRAYAGSVVETLREPSGGRKWRT
ncbi:hypothetical protein [Candidatus Methanoperedens nitratireducens]|nr:hypothetical protein [Candidatus Methanoperedens nitroreducens]